MSLYKIINRYPDKKGLAEIYFFLGKSFENLDEPGQAIDSYQMAIDLANTNEKNKEFYWLEDTYCAINNLKNEKE